MFHAISPSVLLLIACLTIAPSSSSASPPPLAAVEALERLSVSKPCAAAALLYVMLKTDDARSGAFFLPGVATSREIAQLIGLKGSGVEDFPVQPNLYGEATFYTEVPWSLERLNDRVVMVTSSAHLVNAAGVTLEPYHVIETPTRSLLLGQIPRVLPAESVD